MGKLRILNESGDREIPWVEDDLDSIKAAEALFHEHRQNGFAMFAKAGNGHELVKTFDPGAEEILIVRPLAGG